MARGVDSTIGHMVIHQTIMMVSIKTDFIKVTSKEMICTTKKSTADCERTPRHKFLNKKKAKKSTTIMKFSKRRSTNDETRSKCPRTLTFV